MYCVKQLLLCSKTALLSHHWHKKRAAFQVLVRETLHKGVAQTTSSSPYVFRRCSPQVCTDRPKPSLCRISGFAPRRCTRWDWKNTVGIQSTVFTIHSAQTNACITVWHARGCTSGTLVFSRVLHLCRFPNPRHTSDTGSTAILRQCCSSSVHATDNYSQAGTPCCGIVM